MSKLAEAEMHEIDPSDLKERWRELVQMDLSPLGTVVALLLITALLFVI